jgi:hypothetical protein
MAPSPSDDGPVSVARTPSRVVAQQACDGCRLRKRRCTFKEAGGIRWANTEQATEQATGRAPDAATRCHNCEKANSRCTFLLPFKTRGPKRKADHRYMTLLSTSPDQNLEWEGDMLERQSQRSNSYRSPPNTFCIAENVFLADTSIGSISSPMQERPYATDRLLPRDLVRFILGDYVTYVYPLIPVIHIPTFEINFNQEHDNQDEEFLSLIISLCALTVGLLPSRLQAYHEYKSPLPFKTRTEMANHCYKLNQSFRDVGYFDTVNHQKWASSYLLALTFHQTGNTNVWRMLEVESMQLLRLLEVQKTSSYIGLDAIEAQLRKKAFWLMFYSYVHHTHSLRHERVSFLDPMILQEIKLEELMPASVDDGYISSRGILPCPEHIAAASLTAGYNIHSRIFSAALTHSSCCMCPQAKDPAVRLARLKDQLRHLKYMLDTVQPKYRPWNKITSAHSLLSEDDSVKNIQREVIRANIQITHLWLQIMLLDEIDTIKSEQRGSILSPERSITQVFSGSSFSPACETRTLDSGSWDERENLCRELLHTIHSFSHSALEPNGNALVSYHLQLSLPPRISVRSPRRVVDLHVESFASNI